ncbi:DUF2844 domain-containing protein [Rhodoferax sp.]|uniref:DUF2844 domain-containing protein n=1 Tax=Rhodoferax sp. TaxID=50421 RepID=UPI00284E6A93|nr:DUF2844 domain-containing protein [Rhodoferax sp.]MDR3368272.1 DUF2844 domain-containing protein [Rhodoferax sp.]
MQALKYLIAVTFAGWAMTPALAALGRAPLAEIAGTLAATAASQVVAAKKLAAVSPNPTLYTLQSQTLDTGTVVTEYVNSGGIVFALTWVGPVLPDLTLLLGDYFPTFKAQTDRRRAAGQRGGPVQVNADGLTVGSAGRMGHFSGYAYAASLVPTGVDVAALLKDAP